MANIADWEAKVGALVAGGLRPLGPAQGTLPPGFNIEDAEAKVGVLVATGLRRLGPAPLVGPPVVVLAPRESQRIIAALQSSRERLLAEGERAAREGIRPSRQDSFPRPLLPRDLHRERHDQMYRLAGLRIQ